MQAACGCFDEVRIVTGSQCASVHRMQAACGCTNDMESMTLRMKIMTNGVCATAVSLFLSSRIEVDDQLSGFQRNETVCDAIL